MLPPLTFNVALHDASVVGVVIGVVIGVAVVGKAPATCSLIELKHPFVLVCRPRTTTKSTKAELDVDVVVRSWSTLLSVC